MRERLRNLTARAAASRAGGVWFLRFASRVDPALLRWTRGWLSLEVGQPILLLRTVGAKSGAPRENPLLYGTDGPRLVLIASRAGDTRHPAWFHNLRANPEVEVVARRRSGRYLARVAEGEERARLWADALRRYPGYATYQDRAAAREIPVVVLEPAGAAGR